MTNTDVQDSRKQKECLPPHVFLWKTWVEVVTKKGNWKSEMVDKFLISSESTVIAKYLSMIIDELHCWGVNGMCGWFLSAIPGPLRDLSVLSRDDPDMALLSTFPRGCWPTVGRFCLALESSLNAVLLPRDDIGPSVSCPLSCEDSPRLYIQRIKHTKFNQTIQ